MLICSHCNEYYIGETKDLRQRSNKSRSDIRIRPDIYAYTKHFRECSKLVEPYFKIFPLFYESDANCRKYKEWRFIKLFAPTLNGKM